MMSKELTLWFDHGLGDCVDFAHLLQLYKRRGYKIKVHYEENKAAVWQAAGIDYHGSHNKPSGAAYVPWHYRPEFNRPHATDDAADNKICGNLNVSPLPDIGDVWQELKEVRLDGSLESISLPACDFDLPPKPFIVLHTRGTNFQNAKSIDNKVCQDLYQLLLDAGYSLILADWDKRVPAPADVRIRHLKRDFGHLSLPQFYNVLRQAALLIGVDSGPLHLASMSNVPALGVFQHLYGPSVMLPRPDTAMLVKKQPANIARRADWNVIEYEKLTAEVIAKHALRMAAGTRYCCSAGLDAMLQHFALDSQKPVPGGYSPRNTFDKLLPLLREFNAPRIVETGSIRSLEDWSAGYATYIFAAWLSGCAGSLTTIECERSHCELARKAIAPWQSHAEVIEADSVHWLMHHDEPIDCLYCDTSDEPKQTLAEVQQCQPKIIVIDDTTYDGGWKGKGQLAVPYLLTHGYKLHSGGYGVILVR